MLAKEVAKPPDMLREPAIGHIAAVARENFRLRAVRRDAVFVRVAQDELTRLQGIPGAGRGLLARPLNDRLRQTVPVTEMIMGVIKRRNGVKVEHGEDLDAGAAGDKLLVLRDAPVMLRLVPREENDDGMQIGTRKPADPMFRGVHASVAKRLRPRRHALLELLRKRRERSLVEPERAEAVPGKGRRHPPPVLVDASAHRRRRMDRLSDR